MNVQHPTSDRSGASITMDWEQFQMKLLIDYQYSTDILWLHIKREWHLDNSFTICLTLCIPKKIFNENVEGRSYSPSRSILIERKACRYLV